MSKLTVEELLKPRYEVIALYPDCDFKIGQIIEFEDRDEKGILTFRESEYWSPQDFDNYPHLFRKLSWWEKRSVEEMPEYVKDEKGVGRITERMHKNLKDCIIVAFANGNGCCSHLDNWLPATELEYQSQVKQTL